MTNKNSYDVIVVGGSIAGSTAGYILSKLGLDVLIIDKEKFPRKKLCGGIVTLKTLHLLNKIYGETYSSLKQKKILDYITNDYEITYRMRRSILKTTSKYPYIFVDRTVYDNFLLQKAKDIGTEVIEGQFVKSVDLDECTVSLSDGTSFNANFIIGADGANSVVRREFNRKGLVSKKQWNHNLGTGLEIFVDRKDVGKNDFKHPILALGLVKWGYAWMFPNKDKLVIGLGALNRKNKGNFVNALHDWVSCLNINSNSLEKTYGHPVPYGNFKFKPSYKGKVLLIGDAGGFVCTLFGEGLYLGMKTAEFAATAIYNNINDNKAIEESYLWNLKKKVYPDLEAAMTLRFFFFNKIFSAFECKLTRVLVKKTEDLIMELMSGERSPKWFKKRNLNLLKVLE